MKKILFAAIFFPMTIFAGWLDDLIDFGGGGTNCVGENPPVFCGGVGLKGGADEVKNKLRGISKESDAKKLIVGWTNFLFSVAAVLAVVALIWAGILYVTAFGEDSRMETAKKIIFWDALGIILILSAYALVATLMKANFGA